MAKTGRSARVGARGAAVQGFPQLAELQRQFARFRATHAPGARIPASLRGEVVAAVARGVTWEALQRTCGVTWGQVAAWRARQHAPSASAEEASSDGARVFSVVDDGGVGGAAGEQELVLRLGPWSVTVRVGGDAAGGKSCSL
jgi:hypothetical protein